MSSILFGEYIVCVPSNHHGLIDGILFGEYVICICIYISSVPSNHCGLIDAWLDGILNHKVITAKIKVQDL